MSDKKKAHREAAEKLFKKLQELKGNKGFEETTFDSPRQTQEHPNIRHILKELNDIDSNIIVMAEEIRNRQRKSPNRETNSCDASFTGNILDHNAGTEEDSYYITIDLGDLDPGISSTNVNVCGPDCICWEQDLEECPVTGCTYGSQRPDLHKVLSMVIESLEIKGTLEDYDEIDIAKKFKHVVVELYGEREE